MTDQCMWNKKNVCFRYLAVCKQMGLKYIKGTSSKRERKTTMIDGVGDMETIMSTMTVNGLR